MRVNRIACDEHCRDRGNTGILADFLLVVLEKVDAMLNLEGNLIRF
jgi:hypothetical protein